MNNYQYSNETAIAASRVPAGTVSARAHRIGINEHEPLIVMLDCLIRYAQAYKIRQGSPLCEDYVLGEEWLSAVKGARGLLNGDGAVAMRRGISTDSKDNSACEAMFWTALQAAGYTEETANI